MLGLIPKKNGRLYTKGSKNNIWKNTRYGKMSKKKWNDVWRLSFGAEYQMLDWLTLRAAYLFDESPMTERYEDYLVPTKDRNCWSVGVGFAWNSWKLDLAYMLIAAKVRAYQQSDDVHTLKSRTHKDNTTHVGTISISYEF